MSKNNFINDVIDNNAPTSTRITVTIFTNFEPLNAFTGDIPNSSAIIPDW